MLGKPVSIPDEDIDVSFPSDSQFSSQSVPEDFADTDYFIASILLARVGARITASTYSRRPQQTTFSDRVQQGLRALDDWLQELPAPLRVTISQVQPNAPMHIITLYLYFNQVSHFNTIPPQHERTDLVQCFILVLRPVLLYALRMRRMSLEGDRGNGPPSPRETASALSEACLQCARRSFYVLTESWINGSFPTFDYTYTQYLFSASLVLAISSLSNDPGSLTDGDNFETAVDILRQLDEIGNFAAKEFRRHVESIKLIFEGITLEESHVGRPHWSRAAAAAGCVTSRAVEDAGPSADTPANVPILNLAEPSLESLLSQSDFDLGIIDPSITNDGFQTFMWPEEGYSSWLGG